MIAHAARLAAAASLLAACTAAPPPAAETPHPRADTGMCAELTAEREALRAQARHLRGLVGALAASAIPRVEGRDREPIEPAEPVAETLWLRDVEERLDAVTEIAAEEGCL